eukprot:TRINITY_DN4845_c0_g1_i1.p1 TRINITY_DN4845_c0_g1~~TRINITY_DN4845_c0_g1_i1.p1  ORF type:complete len:368 (-),score=77.24 TRINITY_DN4845_c0_g1_i1:17-1120(-)
MEQKKPIGLIFDINRTILIEDKAAGKTRQEEICAVLASCTFGKREGTEWVADLTHPIQYEAKEGYLSYYQFIEDLFPFPTSYPKGTTVLEKHKIISDLKDKRRDLCKLYFREGQPGFGFLPEFHKMVKATEQPEGFSLLPSFYETVAYFTKEEQPFSLCFRTFGVDLITVREEWNNFCSGNHPDFPEFKDEKYILTQENMGAFWRKGPNSEDCFLIMGTIEQPKIDGDMSFYDGKEVTVYQGFKAIDEFIQSKYTKKEIFALRDYYPWWASQGERSNSGKMLFVGDEHDNPQSSRIPQFFFDDNFWLDNFQNLNKLIGDIRTPDGEVHPDIVGLFGKAVFQAQPLYAINDRRYFVNLILASQNKNKK